MGRKVKGYINHSINVKIMKNEKRIMITEIPVSVAAERKH